MQPPARQQSVGNALVVAQFSLIGLCLLPVGPQVGTGLGRALGLVLLAAGLVVGGLALHSLGSDTRVHPVPAAGAQLRTSGIYSVIRHPMYAAVLLACAGVTLASGRLLALVALAGLLVVLHVKVRFEDRLLAERFGAQFAEYARRVPAVVPRPWRSTGR